MPFIKSGGIVSDSRSFPITHPRVIPDDIGLAASRTIELPVQERLHLARFERNTYENNILCSFAVCGVDPLCHQAAHYGHSRCSINSACRAFERPLPVTGSQSCFEPRLAKLRCCAGRIAPSLGSLAGGRG